MDKLIKVEFVDVKSYIETDLKPIISNYDLEEARRCTDTFTREILIANSPDTNIIRGQQLFHFTNNSSIFSFDFDRNWTMKEIKSNFLKFIELDLSEILSSVGFCFAYRGKGNVIRKLDGISNARDLELMGRRTLIVIPNVKFPPEFSFKNRESDESQSELRRTRSSTKKIQVKSNPMESDSDWSSEDKQKLLSILQDHGSGNLNVIQRFMPHKSLSEIRNICNKHMLLARKMWHVETGRGKKKDWTDILNNINSSHRGMVHDIIPRVLKYIALFEKRKEDSSVNLKDCYLVLSDISKGKAPKKLDECTESFLFGCVELLAWNINDHPVDSFVAHLENLKSLISLRNRKHGKKSCTDYYIKSPVINPLIVPKNILMEENN